ncbi:endonuclease [Gramella sp. AN32]|nr:endonuclease [Gramella sp. AN32]
MAYNIHHANPPSKPDVIDINAIINVIRNQNPDVVALQEVDVNTERSGPINQAEIIATGLNMNYYFGKAIDYDGGEYGVAILSKFPISETVINRLPTAAGTNGEPRILLTVKIQTSEGNEIRFGSTHLDAQSAPTNRLVQIQKIVNLAKNEELPFIIAGDFNALPESEVVGILDSHFDRTCRLCPFTIPANEPTRTIDYIAFNHPQQKFRVEEHKVVDESYASDHRPVTATIQILE